MNPAPKRGAPCRALSYCTTDGVLSISNRGI